MAQGRYANIIIDISHEKVDRPFQYKIPDSLAGMLEIGMCVTVPFGMGSRLRQGYVVEITDQVQYPADKLKEVHAIEKNGPFAEQDAVRLAAWMKSTYGATMIAALKTVLPVKKAMKPRQKKKILCLAGREELLSLLGEAQRKKQHAKERVLSQLVKEPELPYELLTKKLNVSPAALRSLEEQGVIRIEAESYYRNPVKIVSEREVRNCLSPEQAFIRDEILSEYEQGVRRTYLIRGITGSGKTEVYLALIEGVLARGKQCIMLIPEIALTYQTLLRFYKRFGDRVSVINSSLSAGERFDQCERARKGEIDVIIGPRSALFVPFERLGLIVMDEEHEGSYKSETMPRYHARETAEFLAGMKGASLVLGSATPSLEAYHKAKSGRYRLFTLDRRLTGGSLPEVHVVDLRRELKEGNRSIFSRRLQDLMEERLHREEQIILFLNRRGYAGFVSCRSCGYVMKCPHCDVSLSQHMGGKMVCHYCGYETVQPKKCLACASPYILGFKAGTQQIEEQLGRRFPGARVLRMDADVTRKKDSYEKILSSFFDREADILVGTQMIVKGHDFPGVTLVGILAADLSLNDSDYRCAERTFQLLTQAAGRAGRGERPGEVVIQTYRPDHYSIVRARAQDYEAFYEEEMAYRELAGYPPAAHMLAILIMAAQEREGGVTAQEIATCLKEDKELAVIGPSKASIGKINDIYRFVIYCKQESYGALVEAKDRIERFLASNPGRETNVQFDFDPIDRY